MCSNNCDCNDHIIAENLRKKLKELKKQREEEYQRQINEVFSVGPYKDSQQCGRERWAEEKIGYAFNYNEYIELLESVLENREVNHNIFHID
jgi:hypothetical protein